MRNVIITGGSGGIGKAIALTFARGGDRVFIGYCSSGDSAKEAADSLHQKGYEAYAVKLDVTDATNVSSAFDRIAADFGGIDVLVNNAGAAKNGLFQEMDPCDSDRLFEVNLRGAERCSRCAVRHMLKNKQGVIINIASIWGEVGASCEVDYSAAKAGVIGLTKALAKEVAPSGIRVNAVSPGVILTSMLDCYDEDVLKALADETPLGRLGKPEDVADAVHFLASDAAGFITGQVLGVDGGFGR